MLLAAVGDTTYNVFLLLHILSAMAAFAPAFAHPFLIAQSRELDAEPRGRMLSYLVANGRRVYAPALIVTGIVGFGLAGLSDQAWKMSQTWLVIAFVAWVAMNGVLHAMVIPAERALSEGDEGAQKRADLGGAILSVLLLVMLYTMIFKPGI